MENILFQIPTSISTKTITDILEDTEYDQLIKVETLHKFHMITGKLNPVQQDKLIDKFKEQGYYYNGQFIIS